MTFFRIVLQVAGLYFFYLMGVWIQKTLHLPVPGSIIGMLLLFFLLLTGLIKRKWLENGADFLLDYLPLIFLPSVIGVMEYGSFFIHKGLVLAVIVLLDSMIVMGLAAWTSQWLSNRNNHPLKSKYLEGHR